LRDGATADWEAFASWLSQDPQNAIKYDEVALLDQDLNEPLAALPGSAPTQTNDNPAPEAGGTRRWLIAGAGTALAAAIAAVVVIPSLSQPGPDFYEIATRPGEHRIVAFGEGNRILLNGSSRVRLDRNDVRFASLESGEASFQIKHDAKAPFALELGNDRLVDIGTSFNVTRYPTGHVVAVAEGAVLYNPDREAVKLAAGQRLKRDDRGARILISAIDPAEVGGWQRGLLTYRGASLSDVASDLSRNLGKPVRVSARLASRSFTGTIEIDRDESRLFERLGKLLGIESRRTAEGWDLDASTTSAG
jgi:transmembrane sensor